MVDASMGIYLFNTDVLLPALMKDAEDPDSKHDFGHDILPGILGRYKISAYNFVDENKQNALYWRDVGTLEAYFDANMDVASVSPIFNLYDKAWPMRTRQRHIRRPSSSLANRAVPAWPSTRYFRGLHRLRRGGAQQRAFPGRACELLRRGGVEHHLLPTSTSAATAASGGRSSTAMCTCPKAR